ncbi:MAG: hypothetical protein WB615_01480 [Candidatus Tumulicola sp.]
MSQICFEDARPAVQVDPGRTDVACFVGLVRRAGFVISDDAVRGWFGSQGLLRFPFTPAPGAGAPWLPSNVRAWFLSQGWIQGLAGGAADSGVIASLATNVTADALQLPATSAPSDDAPLFARIGAEIVEIVQTDATRTILTVVRGAGGTHAAVHSRGDPIVALAIDPLAQLAVQLSNAIPSAVQTWLEAQGWLTGRFARDLDQLYDIPIPLENYTAFTQMFDPGGSGASTGTDYVAAAIQSFFTQGAKRCYVVRMGDPVAATDTASDNDTKLQSISIDASHQGGDPSSWHGVGHLAGLPDVSFVAVPDLPVLCASAPPANAEAEPSIVRGPVQFAECSQEVLVAEQAPTYSSPAPRLSSADYARWAVQVANILQYLASGAPRQEPHLREMQLVAAFPLPQGTAVSLAPALDAPAVGPDLHDVIAAYLPEIAEPPGEIAGTNISSAFLQLAYPWLKTTGSAVLSESLEPPDGALVGVLARNALKYGTFNCATKVVPAGISDLWPAVPPRDTKVSPIALTWGGDAASKALVERMSLFGFTPSGVELLSDVTAYPGEAYRAAAVNRLVGVICRAARRLGETIVFASNGPALWGRVQAFLQKLMTRLWTANALDGATVKDAFSVRCDRSTMTQNDLDNGRLVSQVSFMPASKIELIRVTLAFEAGTTSPQQIASALAQAV